MAIVTRCALSRPAARIGILVFFFLLAAHTRAAGPTQLINFDDVIVSPSGGPYSFPAANYSVLPGDQYADQGVLFSTGDLNTDQIAVDSQVIFTKWRDEMIVADNSGAAVSQPNVLFPAPLTNSDRFSLFVNTPFSPLNGLVYFDILLTFTTPVTSVAITSDHYESDGYDLIRLLALAPVTPPNEFRVLMFDEKYDDAVALPADRLSVDLGGRPFSYALVEVISEREGFDNLTFTQVPEPAASLLAAIGILASVTVRTLTPRGSRLSRI